MKKVANRVRSLERSKSAKGSKSAKPPGGAKKKAATPVEIEPRFAPVVEAFAKDSHVTCGKMMASVGLKVNGKIFAMLVKGELVAKLPKDRVDALVATGNGHHFDPGHGRLMKEWVAVAPGKAPWLDLAREAHRYVESGS